MARRSGWPARLAADLPAAVAAGDPVCNGDGPAAEQSDYLVLLASPQAAASEWVDREVNHWLTRRSADRILPVLIGGEWVWDAATGDLHRTRSTAVPPALFGAFREEPRYLDLRWASTGQELDLRNAEFRDAIAQLAAPIHGRPKSELDGEDVR